MKFLNPLKYPHQKDVLQNSTKGKYNFDKVN